MGSGKGHFHTASVSRYKVSFILFVVRGSKYGKWQRRPYHLRNHKASVGRYKVSLIFVVVGRV
jgi:hypothetical protein